MCQNLILVIKDLITRPTAAPGFTTPFVRPVRAEDFLHRVKCRGMSLSFASVHVHTVRARSAPRHSERTRCGGLIRTSAPRRIILHASRGRLVVAQGKPEERDFVTNMVAKIFGEDALKDPEPMGLKRMTKEDWPDQWPAVTDEWADLLNTDEGELTKLRPLLKQTQLEKLPLGLAYDASVHGWNSNQFHRQLDGQVGCMRRVGIQFNFGVFQNPAS